MKRMLLISVLLSALFVLPSQAQTQTENKGWFGGISAGVPSGYSSFRPTEVGYSGGLFVGYRFNSILSLEGHARLGRTILGTYDNIANQFVGADRAHYYPAPTSISSWQYSALESYVDLQQYGLQLDVNVLGFFNRTKNSNWRIELAPMLSAFNTKADLRGSSLEKTNNWHLGLGGQVQIGYWFASRYGLMAYVEGNHLTGERLDGIPKFRYINNFMGEAGIKFAVGFFKSKAVEPVQEVVAPEPVVEPVKVETPAPKVEPKPVPVEPEPVVEEPFESKVLFDVNKSNIKDTESAKIQEAVEFLKNNPDKKVEVTGWTDPTGGNQLNNALSNRRAEAVKKAIVAAGISADRVSVSGNGVLTEAGDNYVEARAAIIKEAK